VCVRARVEVSVGKSSARSSVSCAAVVAAGPRAHTDAVPRSIRALSVCVTARTHARTHAPVDDDGPLGVQARHAARNVNCKVHSLDQIQRQT
jgi:hypothetical protein